MECIVQRACKGRPREFDIDEALAAALRVFWSKGYEGASLTDLTEAMGITRPSLYAAFGNKEALFRKALDLYEREKLAIDVINGGPVLREWVDDAAATPHDLDALAMPDERAWLGERAPHLRY